MGVNLRDDIFIIRVEKDRNIIYAPLRGVAFYANDKAADICKLYIPTGRVIDGSEAPSLREHIKELERIQPMIPFKSTIRAASNLVVILSQMCNLGCSYCYAQDSRSKDVLSKEQLKVAIDYIFSQKSERKHFSFIGGGEPTLTWELLSWSISYIRASTYDQNKVGIGITTNGTLLDDKKINFFQTNKVDINLSFEILPDVQDSQRCFAKSSQSTFKIVDEAIRKLLKNGVHVGVRSTITKLNVRRMPEMVLFAINNYPHLKKIHFEHVTSIYNDKAYYDDFVKYFMEARTIGRTEGLDVYCSVSRGLEKLKSCFCRGEFCLTPTGDFVACHRISSKEDVAFEQFKFAEINCRVVSISKDRKERIEDFYNSKRQECNDCFAKWHCAGSCPMEKTIYTEKMRDLRCYFTKELTKALLDERLSNSAVDKRSGVKQ